jgi:hypothetical protein
LPIHEGHAVLGPRQVVPRPLRVISHAPGPSPTAGTFIAAGAASLNPETNSRSRAVCFPLDRLDPKTRKTQNPNNTPAAIPCVLPAVQLRENTIESSDGPWDRVLSPQPWKRFARRLQAAV